MRDARRFVAATLEADGLGDLVDTAVLLTSEVVSNAILHGKSCPTVVVETGPGRVRIEVADASSVLPVRKYYRDDATTGRGLMLLARLSAAWGADRLAGGKCVWFEVDGGLTGADGADEEATIGLLAGAGEIDLEALAASFGEVDDADDPGESLTGTAGRNRRRQGTAAGRVSVVAGADRRRR